MNVTVNDCLSVIWPVYAHRSHNDDKSDVTSTGAAAVMSVVIAI